MDALRQPAVDAAELLPASLDPKEASPFRGLVEILQPGVRISGWALNLAEPQDRVSVELLVGEIPVAEVATTLPRPDIAAAGISCATPGFVFPAEVVSGLGERQAATGGGPIRIRIAGTRRLLRAVAPEAGRPAGGASAAETVPQQGGGDDDDAPAWCGEGAARGLALRLDRLMAEGRRLSAEAQLTELAEAVGSIEGICEFPSGFFWVAGWLKKRCPLGFAAALASPAREGAGLVLAAYDRDDLPDNAHGVFGLLRTGAPLPGAGGEAQPVLRFGPSGKLAASLAAEFAVWSPGELLGHHAALRGRLKGRDLQALNLTLLRACAAMGEAGAETGIPLLSTRYLAMDPTSDSDDIERLYAARGAGDAPIPPPPDFNEDAYLAEYPDVAAAVKEGRLSNGFEHYIRWGRAEGRRRPSLLK